MDIAMGICGAVAGGMLMHSAGFGGYRGIIFTTLIAMIGSVLLTLLAGVGERQKDVRSAALSVK